MDGWILVQSKHRVREKNCRNRKEGRATDELLNTTLGEREEEEYNDDKKNLKTRKCTYSINRNNRDNIYKEIKKIMSLLEKTEFFENFQKKFNKIYKHEIKIVGAICLGLGSLIDLNLNSKRACMYQLCFILLVKNIYTIDKIFIYDPKITKMEQGVYSILNIQVLSCKGIYKKSNFESDTQTAHVGEEKTFHYTTIKLNKNERMLLFMPHCDICLYGEVLYNIFIYEQLRYANVHFFFNLDNTIFLGNSFDYYKERIFLYKPFGLSSYIIQMLQENEDILNLKINETHSFQLQKNFKYSHFIFYILNFSKQVNFPVYFEQISAFNDLAIVLFCKIPNKPIFWASVYKFLLDQAKI
ncbi:SRR1-like protein [Plasmodium brasilianum]|uniref:SRR1-like protein n=2 Tax=Plasmodium (Plasmodium) TaxID=418103 RepID=A0A1A8WN55_PLAMA|nr:SRR1-like protein, putative [Plasmodium malariae]KAI4840410.1 SRR1-like protein [Plasmodium brasilianum]SBS94336.1 SRR1-like protein [Plasmodium malariae]SBT86501.1 SRR1-like protein, putative [Plasmodium malariae]